MLSSDCPVVRRAITVSLLATLVGCGSDIASDTTAATSRSNLEARDAAHAARIDNPDVMGCIRATASESELQTLDQGGAEADSTLATVLNRDDMRQCLQDINAVIYL